jgi:hypothetical protein
MRWEVLNSRPEAPEDAKIRLLEIVRLVDEMR